VSFDQLRQVMCKDCTGSIVVGGSRAQHRTRWPRELEKYIQQGLVKKKCEEQ